MECIACGGWTYKGRKSNYIKVFGGYRHEDTKLCDLIRSLTQNPIRMEDLISG